MHLAETSETILRIPAPLVQIIVTILIPLVTGVLTKFTLPSWIKGLLTMLFSAATALISSAIVDGGDAVFTMHTMYNAALNFVIAVATYSGVYKPANWTSSAIGGKLSPEMGIGPRPPS